MEGREKAQRIAKKILNLDASGVYELTYWVPKSDEERVSKAYALSIYAKVLSFSDIHRAAQIAEEAIRTLPDDRKDDELVRKIIAQSLRILSIDAYKRGDKEGSREYLDALIEALKGSKDPDNIAFLERAKAYKARLFGGEYDTKELLNLDLRSPVAFVHAVAAAIAAEDYETLEEIMRRGLLYGTFSFVDAHEVRNALDILYERFIEGKVSEKGEAVIAFFSDKDLGFKGDVARFAINRKDKELRARIINNYKGTALEIIARLEEAREDHARVMELLEALEKADVSEGFKELVKSEAHIIRGIQLYESKEYEMALEEALKALRTENIDLLVSAYRLAIETAMKIDPGVAIRIMDDAYVRLKDYKRNPRVKRLLDVIKGLKPMVLLSQGSKGLAMLESLKSSKRKKK